MGIQDRDYMRTAGRVARASDQRRPGDPRSAGDVFLPGTVHATRRRRPWTMVAVAVASFIATAFAILMWTA